jgi:hypothetical protein
MKTYQHTQPGTTIVASVSVLCILFAIGAIFIHLFVISVLLLGITIWLFRSLTIEISDTDLIWYFGSGWPRKSVLLSEIASAEPIRTGFWNGWGIHYTPRGWLYNVSGHDAVAIKLRSGKQFCLGTDQPQELAVTLTERHIP